MGTKNLTCYHLGNEKRAPGWLLFWGDEILPSYIGDYFINHHKDPVINQPGFNGKCPASFVFFLLAHLEIFGFKKNQRMQQLDSHQKTCCDCWSFPRKIHVILKHWQTFPILPLFGHKKKSTQRRKVQELVGCGSFFCFFRTYLEDRPI